MTYKLTQILQQLEEAGLPEPDFRVDLDFGILTTLMFDSKTIAIQFCPKFCRGTVTEEVRTFPKAIEKLKEVL